MGGGGWKRAALGDNQGKVCVDRKLSVYGNGKFLRPAKKGLCKRKAFGSKKGGLLRIATKGLFKWKVFGL